jgi:DNA repair photolyase
MELDREATSLVPDVSSGALPLVENASILTPTSGFLRTGYTHTINAYQGCAFARSLCGTFCYAQHNRWITKGRAWGLYGAKRDVRAAYRRDFDRIKRPKRGAPKPLKIYMSSSTDPYLPQEKRLRLTCSLLDEMRERTPDVLVIQSHHTLVERDLDLIADLSNRCELWISLTVETDMDPVPGFPPHASPPARRVETLERFRKCGIRTQATVSPLLPLADPRAFAVQLDAACDRVIVDHYLIGDGSTNGWRTKRTTFAERLQQAGFGAWNNVAKLWEIRDVFAKVLGDGRVLVGCEGFNAVGEGAIVNKSPTALQTELLSTNSRKGQARDHQTNSGPIASMNART